MFTGTSQNPDISLWRYLLICTKELIMTVQQLLCADIGTCWLSENVQKLAFLERNPSIIYCY